MASDPQNKERNLGEKVVSLNRHEFVADIERKLSKARRLFSLRDYPACEQLVDEVLKLDPGNPNAKALFELTSIKLSKKKLYKELVDPSSRVDAVQQSARDVEASDDISSSPDLKPLSSQPGAFIPPLVNSTSQEKGLEEAGTQKTTSRTEPSHPKEVPTSSEITNYSDTMRERTINALVELFSQREKTLEAWQDPRFKPVSQPGREFEPGGDPEPPTVHSEMLSHPQPAPDVKAPGGPFGLEEKRFAADPVTEGVPPTTLSSKPSPIEASQPLFERPAEVPDFPGSMPTAELERPAKMSAGTESPDKARRLPNAQLAPKKVPAARADYKQLVESKIEQHSKDLRNSEIKTVSIAQIKKYLYQEEYDLCAHDLERIRKLFPQNAEIQAFVENTSKRLAELQRLKAFEKQAKELMLSAASYYQEGKLQEALIAAKEVLRVIPEHEQARDFVSYVQKRLDKERRKGGSAERIRYCWACGIAVDSASQFCFHCGRRLS